MPIPKHFLGGERGAKLPPERESAPARIGAGLVPEDSILRRNTMKHSLHIPLVLLIAALATQNATEAQIPSAMQHTTRQTITAKELAKNPQTDLYAYLTRRHPLWLNTRGPVESRSPGVVVYVDGMRRGGVEELRRIPLETVVWVDHYSGPEAALRWGSGHSHGTIHVATGVSGFTRAG